MHREHPGVGGVFFSCVNRRRTTLKRETFGLFPVCGLYCITPFSQPPTASGMETKKRKDRKEKANTQAPTKRKRVRRCGGDISPLPDEVWLHVFEYLHSHPHELLNLRAVCRWMRRIVQDNSIWHPISIERLGPTEYAKGVIESRSNGKGKTWWKQYLQFGKAWHGLTHTTCDNDDKYLYAILKWTTKRGLLTLARRTFPHLEKKVRDSVLKNEADTQSVLADYDRIRKRPPPPARKPRPVDRKLALGGRWFQNAYHLLSIPMSTADLDFACWLRDLTIRIDEEREVKFIDLDCDVVYDVRRIEMLIMACIRSDNLTSLEWLFASLSVGRRLQREVPRVHVLTLGTAAALAAPRVYKWVRQYMGIDSEPTVTTHLHKAVSGKLTSSRKELIRYIVDVDGKRSFGWTGTENSYVVGELYRHTPIFTALRGDFAESAQFLWDCLDEEGRSAMYMSFSMCKDLAYLHEISQSSLRSLFEWFLPYYGTSICSPHAFKSVCLYMWEDRLEVRKKGSGEAERRVYNLVSALIAPVLWDAIGWDAWNEETMQHAYSLLGGVLSEHIQPQYRDSFATELRAFLWSEHAVRTKLNTEDRLHMFESELFDRIMPYLDVGALFDKASSKHSLL